ncbi:hypothetical protein [Nostoc sp.]|uniref:hypothetical protein n=1 Tax=Nostoc sp. TaxID=1180 RepID=UPI002FF902C8
MDKVELKSPIMKYGENYIDGDIILVAQVVTIIGAVVAIAISNVGHFSRFVAADLWQNIKTS